MCRYATERWETVLHYMVASSQQGGISADAVRTLLQVTSSVITVPSLVLVTVKTPHHPQAGLMSPDENQGNSPVITRSGFQFLLMERSSQVHTTHY